MSVKEDFLNTSITLIVTFLIAKFLLLYSISLGLAGIIVISAIMFLLSLFFLNACKRTVHRGKEVVFCTISGVLLYSSVFGSLSTMGSLIVSPLIFTFIALLFVYSLFEAREFYEKFISFTMIILIFLSLIQSEALSNFVSSSLIVVGVLVAIVTYYVGTSTQSFDKKSYFSLLFGWSIHSVIERIIFMLWTI
ncbi:MAG: hypothetical protein ACP5GW_04810 [Caldisericaceae bacterium]